METNANQPLQAILDRLDRVESEVEDLHRRIATIDGTRANPAQVFCPNCNGGNPPGGFTCMWCGRLMPQKAGWQASQPIPTPVSAIAAQKEHVVRSVPVHAPEKTTPATPWFKAALVEGKPVPLESATHSPAPPASPAPGVTRPATPQAPAFNFDFLKTSEFWLNKVGIGLLLLGLAFFFKYSIDRGWLNEPVRVGLGLLVSSLLLGFGLAMHRKRPIFSQVLLGGSVASYYITGYAAYQLFNLVPYEVAFGFMALVTALAFGLALRENEAALSLIGLVGGLLTPFVLTAPSAGVTGLVVYTCIVLAGVASIYLYKGWRSLLWAGYVGGWLVFGVASMGSRFDVGLSTGERWALQAGALFCLVAFWAVPVLREALYARNPARWSRPTLDKVPELSEIINRHVFVLAIVTPLMTLGYSQLVWDDMVSKQAWGWLTLVLAAAYGATAWLLRPQSRWALPALAYAHVLMAILLMTLGIVQIFEGNALILSLAVEATALHFVSRRLSDRGTAIYGHLVSAVVAVWVGTRIAGGLVLGVGLTAGTLTDLAVIALLAASSFAVWPKEFTFLYRNAVHLAFMGWIFGLLYELPYWSGLVMLAWAAYAMAIYVAHLMRPARFGDYDMAYPAHALFASAAVMFGWRILTGQVGEWAVLNLNTLLDAAFVAMVVAMSFMVKPREAVATYRLAAHFAVLALLWRELSVLPNGLSYVMLSWAAYGLGMHYLSRRLPDRTEASLLSMAANVPFVGVVLLFISGLTAPAPDVAVFNLPALLSLASIGLALGASFIATPRQITLAYWLGAYVMGLGWLAHELMVLSNEQGYIILSWAALASALLYLARRVEGLEKTGFIGVASATLGLVYIWLILRLLSPISYDTPVLNPADVSDLAVIGLLALSAYLVPIVAVRWSYLLGAHIALLAWFWRELSTLENGNAYVTIAWGAYAIALLVVGLRSSKDKYHMPVLYAGIATLLLVVAKLFLVDLSALDPLWRVLLFMGFGGVFLLLSYFFQNAIGGRPGSQSGGTPKRPHWPGRSAH